MKKNPSKKIITIVFCLLTLVAFVAIRQYRIKEKERLVAYKDRLHRVVEDYFRSKPFENIPVLAPRDFAGIVAFQELYRKKATEAIEKCKNVSPLASKIASHYRQFRCTLFENGVSKMVQMGPPDREEIRKKIETTQELCFFLPSDKTRFRLPSSLYWNDPWNAVMVQMTDWPETVFAGMLIHELGHGYHSTVLHSESAHAPQNSESFLGEEIAMHELEAAVFNELSKGEYYRICDIVVSKAKGSKVEQILAGLELKDLQELDRCLGAELASKELANLLIAEHITVICCRYMDKHGLGMRGKIQAYRWFISANL